MVSRNKKLVLCALAALTMTAASCGAKPAVPETTAAPVQDSPSPGGPSPAIVQPVPSENSSPEEAGPGTVQPVPDSVPAGPGA